MTDLRIIQQKLSEIKRRGYVRTKRRGPTGVGYTLESLLQIQENNISSPDFGTIELKSHRHGHSALLSLFTFNRKVWVMPPLVAIRKYGSPDEDGRLGLYYTMGLRPNSAGLFLFVGEEIVAVRSIDGNEIAKWRLSDLALRFAEKVANVLLVSAAVELRNNVEYFWFDRARILTGGTSVSILRNQFATEKLLLDLRLHDAGTRARNHGTGFRVSLSNLQNIYSQIVELEI